MKGLRKKLKDQSGASILLALLFFLLCSMVGASVLMAAVSNAGKIRSNRAEQQKYLLLSSALRLVCDELTSAEYYGMYTYTTWIEVITIEELEDGTKLTETHTYHEYEQTPGKFQCGGLEAVLPLKDELDRVFASEFPSSGDDGTGRIHYIYSPNTATFISKTHDLRVDTSHVGELDGSESEVTVKVQMDQNLHIWLTATLGGETNGDTMKALLTGQGDLRLAEPDSAPPAEPDIKHSETKQAGPVKWTLEWIAKKEAGDDT